MWIYHLLKVRRNRQNLEFIYKNLKRHIYNKKNSAGKAALPGN